MSEENNLKDFSDGQIEKMLDQILISYKHNKSDSLREIFDKVILSKGISQFQAEKTLEIERKTLNAILDGTSKRIDYEIIIRLADFLKMQPKELNDKYFNTILENYYTLDESIEKKKFIVDNFDLKNLKKCNFIDSISDFEHIEKRILEHFEYNNIYEYKQNRTTSVFSSVKNPENAKMREFWVESSVAHLKKINNHFKYDRKLLIDLIPKIRSFTMDESNGLINVIRALFKVGVTVIYRPYLPTLHARGATISVNDKPCIILTNYRKNFATIWYAFIHELHHVLFDWEYIKSNYYHITGEPDLLDDNKREDAANEFAKQYLFNDSKLDEVSRFINSPSKVKEFAIKNQIHESIIYSFYKFDNKEYKGTNRSWSKNTDVDANKWLKPLEANEWNKPISERTKIIKEKIFNI